MAHRDLEGAAVVAVPEKWRPRALRMLRAGFFALLGFIALGVILGLLEATWPILHFLLIAVAWVPMLLFAGSAAVGFAALVQMMRGKEREVLLELARDEGRHAAHGWDVVEWCLEEGGAPVANALRGAAKALPRKHASQLPEGLEAYGLHGAQLETGEHALARAALIEKVRDLLERSAAPSG